MTEQDKTNTDNLEQKIEGMTLNPNEFSNNTGGVIDYDKIIEGFGVQKLTKELIDRFEKIIGQPCHPLLTRGLFFSHRDFNIMCDYLEAKKFVYLYTGRGPSTDSMHLGHLLPFILTKWMQDVLNCHLVIQLSDDEKFFYQKTEPAQNLEYFQKIGDENAKDIIACGFNPEKTFIFKNSTYMPYFYENVIRFQKSITYNQIKGIFGLDGSENSGKISYPAIQAAPIMSSSFKHLFGDKNDALCIIPMGIDQDPYFRMARDIATKLKIPKPVCVFSKFFPALQGFNTKMSSSDSTSAIFLTDKMEEIKSKINKYAFSGGQATVEEHRLKGGNTDIDVAYNYLYYFDEDEEKVLKIGEKYRKGEMLSGELKKEAISVIQKIVKNHQDARSKVTNEILRGFMSIKTILK